MHGLLKEVISSKSVIRMMKSSAAGCRLPKQGKECLKQGHLVSDKEKFDYLSQSSR